MYRFWDSPNVDEKAILSGLFALTGEHIASTDGPVLVLHDTTELSFNRDRETWDGTTTRGSTAKRTVDGKYPTYTACAIEMHSALAVTSDGLPLGLLAATFWTRKKFKGNASLERSNTSTRLPAGKKESVRWPENVRQATESFDDPARCVHVADREADNYAFFHEAVACGSNFLVRTKVDRRTKDDATVSEFMADAPVRILHKVQAGDANGRTRTAVLEIRYRKTEILPPATERGKFPPLSVTVIYADERDPPERHSPISWKLVTNLDVSRPTDAIEKVEWYALRWNIETFHKVLKSGCKVEKSQLRTARRLTNLIATDCIIAWRIFWLSRLNRATPDAAPETALTDEEIHYLDVAVKDEPGRSGDSTISHYIIKIARLGGYLRNPKVHPPGVIVMWRGLYRLHYNLEGATNMEMGRRRRRKPHARSRRGTAGAARNPKRCA